MSYVVIQLAKLEKSVKYIEYYIPLFAALVPTRYYDDTICSIITSNEFIEQFGSYKERETPSDICPMCGQVKYTSECSCEC